MMNPTLCVLRNVTPVSRQQANLGARVRFSQRATHAQRRSSGRNAFTHSRKKLNLYRLAHGSFTPSAAAMKLKIGNLSSKNHLLKAALGGLLLLPLLSGYCWYLSHLDKVPITNRVRFMWPVSEEFDEEIGCAAAEHSTALGKPYYRSHQSVAVMVRKIVDRLLEAEEAKGLEIRLHVYEDHHVPAASALTKWLFISTAILVDCQNVDEVAGIIAHEMGHIIARHLVEQSISKIFTTHLARLFKYRGFVGRDLTNSRVHEAEADHIAIVLTTKAGFDPHALIDYFERLAKEEELDEERPDVLNTHPPCRDRVKAISSMVPMVKGLYEDIKKAPFVLEEWDRIRKSLQRAQEDDQQARKLAKPKASETMLPDIVAKLEEMHEMIGQLQEQFNNTLRHMEGTAISTDNRQSEAISEIALQSIDRIKEVPNALQQQSSVRNEVMTSEVGAKEVTNQATVKEASHLIANRKEPGSRKER